MKFFACLFVLVAVASSVSADKTDKKDEFVAASYGAPAPAPSPSYAPPPCPKNYLFSCQPNIAPVPCAPARPGYAGAYSEHVPQYIMPQYAHPQYGGLTQY